MPDSPDRGSLIYSEQDMAREAMKRLGNWILRELDMAVNLSVPPEKFKASENCQYMDMQEYCEECSFSFLEMINRNTLACGQFCYDAAYVLYDDSAQALLRSAIECIITARYVLNGPSIEEKIQRMLCEELETWKSSTRADNELDQWIFRNRNQDWIPQQFLSIRKVINKRIGKQKMIENHLKNHLEYHFPENTLTSLPTEQKIQKDDEYFRIGYYFYRDTSAAVHGNTGTRSIIDDASLYGAFSWVVRAIAQTLGEYRVLLGMESRGAELWREAMSLADQWSATE